MKIDFENTLVESIGVDDYGRIMGIKLNAAMKPEVMVEKLNDRLLSHGIIARVGEPHSAYAAYCDMAETPPDSLVIVTLRGDKAKPQQVIAALEDIGKEMPDTSLQLIDHMQLDGLSRECDAAVGRRR